MVEIKSVDGEIEHDIDFDDEGNVILKKKVKVKMGAKSRAGGSAFEARVRKDLEEKGWVVESQGDISLGCVPSYLALF